MSVVFLMRTFSLSSSSRSFSCLNFWRSSSIACCLASSRSSDVAFSCSNLRRSSSSFAHVVAMAPNTAAVPKMIANALDNGGLIRIGTSLCNTTRNIFSLDFYGHLFFCLHCLHCLHCFHSLNVAQKIIIINITQRKIEIGMSTHRASRYGNKQLFVVSDECTTPPNATGASVLFHSPPPVVAPPGLRLLLSLEQADYSRSISNITTPNQTITFQSRGGEGIVTCTIEPVLYPNGVSITNAIKVISWFLTFCSSIPVGRGALRLGAHVCAHRALRQPCR